MGKKEDTLQEREALLEMYKAGFLDGYLKGNKLKNKKDWAEMNKKYKKAFANRFEKAITKELKKMEKKR